MQGPSVPFIPIGDSYCLNQASKRRALLLNLLVIFLFLVIKVALAIATARLLAKNIPAAVKNIDLDRLEWPFGLLVVLFLLELARCPMVIYCRRISKNGGFFAHNIETRFHIYGTTIICVVFISLTGIYLRIVKFMQSSGSTDKIVSAVCFMCCAVTAIFVDVVYSVAIISHYLEDPEPDCIAAEEFLPENLLNKTRYTDLELQWDVIDYLNHKTDEAVRAYARRYRIAEPVGQQVDESNTTDNTTICN